MSVVVLRSILRSCEPMPIVEVLIAIASSAFVPLLVFTVTLSPSTSVKVKNGCGCDTDFECFDVGGFASAEIFHGAEKCRRFVKFLRKIPSSKGPHTWIAT
jgi:hypothetical protein